MRHLFLGWLLFCSPLLVAFAASSSFEVGFTIDENDINAPSIPTGLSAVAISTNQIDLSWASSTDNVLVTGYRVFRGGLFIATSTTLSYQDLGLSPNTTYSYEVSAFDAAGNESARSSAVSATTFSLAVSQDSFAGGQGAVAPGTYAALSSNAAEISIEAFENAARIMWSAPQYLVSKIEWGRTLEYELGSSLGPVYSRRKETMITDLESGVRYYFRTEYIDPQGRIIQGEAGSFQTTAGERSSIIDYSHIVSNISLVREGAELSLSWQVLREPSVQIRILASGRAARFIEDGVPVYEGEGTNMRQPIPRSRTVYTFFAVGLGDGKPLATVTYDPSLALPSLLDAYFGGAFFEQGGRSYFDVSIESGGKSIFEGGGIVFDENGGGREVEYRSVLESEYYSARSCQAGFWLCNWWLVVLIIASVLYGLYKKFAPRKRRLG